MSNTPKLSIKDWAPDDRPREKLVVKGRQSLSDAELIAILLGSGNDRESALDLAKRILSEHQNNLVRIAQLSIADWQKYRGIGEAKAVTVAAALELGRRRLGMEQAKEEKIKSSNDAFNLLRSHLNDLNQEEFWMMSLNRANIVLRKEAISRGGVSATVVDAKVIFKKALENGASGIILAHNHPSGETQPSRQDIDLTTKIKQGAALLDISLLDHIIVGANTYFSFADEGMI
jgi:DNA repair protein RadC